MGKRIAVLVIVVLLATLSITATANAGTPQPARIAFIAKKVFGSKWRIFTCLAHFESTDGANLHNGVDLGPWQIDYKAHKLDPYRLVHDWWYSARHALSISQHGTNFSGWPTTRHYCGV